MPKIPDSKIGVVGSTSLPEKAVGSQKTWVFISLHRLQIRYSKILLILARPLTHWLLYFLLFFFFLIFNRMDAWSLMRGDAFIHFVSGSRRVNIRLGVLLLIPKSPQIFKKTINMVNFCSIFMFVFKFVCYWMLVCLSMSCSLSIYMYVCVCTDVFTYFRCLLARRSETKEEGVIREEWQQGKWIIAIRISFSF